MIVISKIKVLIIIVISLSNILNGLTIDKIFLVDLSQNQVLSAKNLSNDIINYLNKKFNTFNTVGPNVVFKNLYLRYTTRRLKASKIFQEFQESEYKGKTAITLSSKILDKTVRVVNIYIVTLADNNKKIKKKKILKMIKRDEIQVIQLTFPIEISIIERFKNKVRLTRGFEETAEAFKLRNKNIPLGSELSKDVLYFRTIQSKMAIYKLTSNILNSIDRLEVSRIKLYSALNRNYDNYSQDQLTQVNESLSFLWLDIKMTIRDTDEYILMLDEYKDHLDITLPSKNLLFNMIDFVKDQEGRFKQFEWINLIKEARAHINPEGWAFNEEDYAEEEEEERIVMNQLDRAINSENLLYLDHVDSTLKERRANKHERRDIKHEAFGGLPKRGDEHSRLWYTSRKYIPPNNDNSASNPDDDLESLSSVNFDAQPPNYDAPPLPPLPPPPPPPVLPGDNKRVNFTDSSAPTLKSKDSSVPHVPSLFEELIDNPMYKKRKQVNSSPTSSRASRNKKVKSLTDNFEYTDILQINRGKSSDPVKRLTASLQRFSEEITRF